MKELTLLLLVFLFIIIIFNKANENKDLKKEISEIDGNTYYVRKLPDSQEAANILSEITRDLKLLVNKLKPTDKEGCDQLISNFNPDNIVENVPESKYTSYSLNKGEKLAICIRHKPTEEFMDHNIIIFVCLHELAHVMTHEVGHTKLFWENMKFLLEKGEEYNIYKPDDYSKNPKMYCGMEINSTPYDF